MIADQNFYNIHIFYVFFNPTASATAYGQRPKFEAIPTAEGFICSFLSFSSKMKCVFRYTGANLD